MIGAFTIAIDPRPMDYRQPSERKSMHARIVQELGMQIVSRARQTR